MGTRSRIGLQLSDGSILSAYHHWDGYPEWLGRILTTHYDTYDKVAELIDGGDMSSCWTDSRWDNSSDGSYGPEYYSQRGEDCPPRRDSCIHEYLLEGEEYAYLYKNNEWICYHMHQYEEDVQPEIVTIPEGALAV
jgi:hypothetical protein